MSAIDDLRATAESGLQRVPHHVRARCDQVRVRLELDREEAVLDEVSGSSVAPVHAPRVVAVQLLHSVREPAVHRPEHEMEMIRHQAPRPDIPSVLRRDARELVAPQLAVELVPHDRAAVVSARDDVDEHVAILAPPITAHTTTVAAQHHTFSARKRAAYKSRGSCNTSA